MRPLYVIKIGSNVFEQTPEVISSIRKLSERKARILLILGGGLHVRQWFQKINRVERFIELKKGGEFRYCTEQDMPHISDAYQRLLFPQLTERLRSSHLTAHVSIGSQNRLVLATPSKPLKAIISGKEILIKDSCVGIYHSCQREVIVDLLNLYNCVCLSPPVAELGSHRQLNIDADMLAAKLCIELEGHHLRFITPTGGILRNLEDRSTIQEDMYLSQTYPEVTGRMKQKIRSSADVLKYGVADVQVTSADFENPANPKTRLWKDRHPNDSANLLFQSISVPSVSGDEFPLAAYLKEKLTSMGIQTWIDRVGNLVSTKGNGKNHLMLLGHMDTVPHLWTPSLTDSELSGRGVVDAKASLINFIHVLNQCRVPPWGKLSLVGAVEEEISSSKGSFYVRDTYHADAVIVGEPSHTHGLTLGYYGLLKLQLSIEREQGHSAGKGIESSSDALVNLVQRLRDVVRKSDPHFISSLSCLESKENKDFNITSGILSFRVSPLFEKNLFYDSVNKYQDQHIKIQILRDTPAYQLSRSNPLVTAFIKGFKKFDIQPKFIVKKGTSDMNTLASSWTDIPMVAYGPGNSQLDHTCHETVSVDDYLEANQILHEAVSEWFYQRRIGD
jgi:LysW-gamma-L-lysine carboxypeptidase